jgi:hypothetical protein
MTGLMLQWLKIDLRNNVILFGQLMCFPETAFGFLKRWISFVVVFLRVTRLGKFLPKMGHSRKFIVSFYEKIK